MLKCSFKVNSSKSAVGSDVTTMNTKVYMRFTSLSRFRELLNTKTFSSEKKTERERLKTDDLFLSFSAEKAEDSLNLGDKSSPSSNLPEISPKDDSKLINIGHEVKKALTSAIEQMNSTVNSSRSDDVLKLETIPKSEVSVNKAGDDFKQTLPENSFLEGISTRQYEKSKMEENKLNMQVINNQSERTLPPGVTSNLMKESYPIVADSSSVHPSLFESPANSFLERESEKHPRLTDTKPTTKINLSDYSYQDYINERLDVKASGQRRERINRSNIHKKQQGKDLGMVTQNKRDINTPESKLHKEYNTFHSDEEECSLSARLINSTNNISTGQHNTMTSLHTRKSELKETSNIFSSIQGPGINFTPVLNKPKASDLYSPQTDFESKNVGYNITKTGPKATGYLQDQERNINQFINEATIKPGHLPMNPYNATQMPALKPSLEHSVSALTQRDFLKYIAPDLKTSYDLVPGPSLLKAVGSVWKYIPILGTQCVSSFIYTAQSIASYVDRNASYPFMNLYYYLLNKYGPMVRLHGPLGADILLLAVNGQDFPIIHIKRKESSYQSLFDSLNVYRIEAPSLNYMLDLPTSWSQLSENPTLTVGQYYSSLEKITENFVNEKRFIYGCNGNTEDDTHENDLIRWALQCNLDVYFKTSKNCMAELDGFESKNAIVDSFINTTKCLRSSESGVQLWRAFTTFTWNELSDSCKQMDRCILEELNDCFTDLSKKEHGGAAVETLLATEEIQVADLLTSLLDLLLINVNTVASTTGFLLYNLSKTPQVQRTLYREISNVVKKGSAISYDDLSQLKYLNACINETLRMAPPFPVLKRLLEEDTNIHRFQIPKGTYIHMVNILPYARGDNYYSKITKFQVERWTEKPTLVAGDPLTGLPQWDSFPKFNRDLVMTQIALLVTKVVREYRIEYPSSDIYPNGKVLQGPSSPFNFTFIERQI